MDHALARSMIAEAIEQVAPEADLEAVGGDESFVDALDLDSMDLLSVVSMLAEQTGIDMTPGNFDRDWTLDQAAAHIVTLSEQLT